MAIDPVDRQLVTGGYTNGNLPGFTFHQDDRNVLMGFVLRHSPAGEQQWARVRGGGGGGQKVQYLQIDPSDRYVAGLADEPGREQPYASPCSCTSAGAAR